jgi:hypothetical protein
MKECATNTNETGYKCTSSFKKQVLCKRQTEEFKLSRCRKVLNASRSVLSPWQGGDKNKKAAVGFRSGRIKLAAS